MGKRESPSVYERVGEGRGKGGEEGESVREGEGEGGKRVREHYLHTQKASWVQLLHCLFSVVYTCVVFPNLVYL